MSQTIETVVAPDDPRGSLRGYVQAERDAGARLREVVDKLGLSREQRAELIAASDRHSIALLRRASAGGVACILGDGAAQKDGRPSGDTEAAESETHQMGQARLYAAGPCPNAQLSGAPTLDEVHSRFRQVLGIVVPDARAAMTVYAAASSWTKAATEATRASVRSVERQDCGMVR